MLVSSFPISKFVSNILFSLIFCSLRNKYVGIGLLVLAKLIGSIDLPTMISIPVITLIALGLRQKSVLFTKMSKSLIWESKLQRVIPNYVTHAQAIVHQHQFTDHHISFDRRQIRGKVLNSKYYQDKLQSSKLNQA